MNNKYYKTYINIVLSVFSSICKYFQNPIFCRIYAQWYKNKVLAINQFQYFHVSGHC